MNLQRHKSPECHENPEPVFEDAAQNPPIIERYEDCNQKYFRPTAEDIAGLHFGNAVQLFD